MARVTPFKRNQLKMSFSKDFQSTLSDETWNSLFSNEHVAGKSVESLTNAIVSGFIGKIGTVTKVTPQRYEVVAGVRASRVDIEAESDHNELVIYEIQILYDKALPRRNTLSSALKVFNRVEKGTTTAELLVKTPKIIHINILCYNIREDNNDIVQFSRKCYMNTPITPTDDEDFRFDVQLPRFRELIISDKVDFKNETHCWLFTIWRCHELSKTPKEVMDMYPELREYAKVNVGYHEFGNRFEDVTRSAEARENYIKWIDETWRQQSVIDSAVEMAIEQFQEIIAEKDAALSEKDAALSEKDAENARLAEEIAALRARLAQST
jgi:hypothetical protein